MLQKIDYWLSGFVAGLNFFMMVIEDSSLYTILPKYLNNEVTNEIRNKSFEFISNSSKNCSGENPQYVKISMIFLAKNFLVILINPFIGIIMDKINNYLILFLAQIFGIVVLMIYALGNTILVYIIGRILDAFVTCVIFIAVYSIISQLFTEIHVRSKYYGFVNTVFAVSHSIGPVYGAKIDEKFGKSGVFLLLTPFWLVSFIFTYILHRRVRKINDIRNKNNYWLRKIAKQNNNLILLHDHCLERNSINLPENSIEIKHENEKSKNETIIIFKMLKDPLVIACLIQLFVVNLSMFSLPPTLPSWMAFRLCSNQVEQGLVWSFGFIGYIFGVSFVIFIDKYAVNFRCFIPIVGQIVIGVLLILIPFSRDWRFLFLPIIGMYISVGVVEQIILPMTTYLSDSRFNSNYGTMSSLTSQSLNICSFLSTLFSGPIAEKLGFKSLTILLGIINLLFSPISLIYRKVNIK